MLPQRTPKNETTVRGASGPTGVARARSRCAEKVGPAEAGCRMSEVIRPMLEALSARAAARCLSIRRAARPPYGWELCNGDRVVFSGSLDRVAEWLDAAENRP